MKTKLKYILFSIICLTTTLSYSQELNWAALQEGNHHIINLNAGIEYGAVFGISYGHQIKNKLFPMVADIEYSFPSGKNMLDDFKTKFGGKIRWIKYNNFQFSTNLHGVFRRYENDFARLLNFGSDFSGIAGYYRNKWFIAGEIGFDKAIITNFKSTPKYRDQYSSAIDGWYEPATGGNFYYGIQAGVSLGKNDIYMRIGKTISQDFETDPLLPLYIQIGYSLKL